MAEGTRKSPFEVRISGFPDGALIVERLLKTTVDVLLDIGSSMPCRSGFVARSTGFLPALDHTFNKDRIVRTLLLSSCLAALSFFACLAVLCLGRTRRSFRLQTAPQS